jgi:hypothetical protein
MLDTAGLLQEAEIPELMLLDAAVEANVSSDWLVYATANNLTNAKGITSWRPFGARPTAPLQVMAGIKWQPSQQAY